MSCVPIILDIATQDALESEIDEERYTDAFRRKMEILQKAVSV